MKTIWAKNGLRDYNSRCYFQIKCEKASKIELIAKDVYQLFIDGKFIGWGPSKTDLSYARKDVYDLSKFNNFVLTVEVVSYNIPSYSICSETPLFGAQIFDGNSLVADTYDFKVYKVNDYERIVQKYSLQRGFSEFYVMEKDRNDFYNGKHSLAEIETVEVKEPKILERSTEFPKYNELICKKIASGNFVIDKNAEHWVENEQMLNNPNQNSCFERYEIREFVSDTVSEFVYKDAQILGDILNEKQYFTYDFGRIVTGLFSLELSVIEDAEVYLSWSELADYDKGFCDFDFSRNTCCDIIKYELKKGKYNLLSFEPYCCEYARVMVLSGKVEVNKLSMRLVQNASLEDFEFTCENKNLEVIVNAAKNTLAQNAVDIFYDCPGRERAGWLCDGYFMGRAETLLCKNNNVEKDYLENFIIFSDSERYPKGMIPMCYPSKVASKKYIPNWAMWFILELGDYYKRTGDVNLVEKAKDRCYGIINFFDDYLNEYGLLENLKSWVFVEWSKANDFVGGVNCPSNIIYSEALKTVGELYNDDKLINRSLNVKNAIKNMFFNGTFFIDNAVRDESGILKLTDNTSETCQYYVLYFGIADGDEYKAFKNTMIDNFGYFRDDKTVFPKVYKSNAFIGNFLRFAYLYKVGEYERLLSECEKYFTPMAKQSLTLWEHNTTFSSLNHGFASYSAVLIINSLEKTKKFKYSIK